MRVKRTKFSQHHAVPEFEEYLILTIFSLEWIPFFPFSVMMASGKVLTGELWAVTLVFLLLLYTLWQFFVRLHFTALSAGTFLLNPCIKVYFGRVRLLVDPDGKGCTEFWQSWSLYRIFLAPPLLLSFVHRSLWYQCSRCGSNKKYSTTAELTRKFSCLNWNVWSICIELEENVN